MTTTPHPPPPHMPTDACMDMTPLEGALHYHRMGWVVTPLCWPTSAGECGCGNPHHTGDPKNIGKAPLAGLGWQHIRPDEAQIRSWWSRWPKANIGIILDPSGLVIVDPDSPEAVDECASLGLLDTATVVTGNGRHAYYTRPEGCPVTRRSRRGQCEKIDVFSRGYVVAPPSWHASGAAYRWLGGGIGPAPAWAVDQLTPKPTAGARRPPKPSGSSDPASTEAWVTDALTHISPDCDMETWVRVGMALHSEWSGGFGLDMWDGWSSTSSKYKGFGDLAKRWRGFDEAGNSRGTVTLGTIAALAEEARWVAPWTKAKARKDAREAVFRGDPRPTPPSAPDGPAEPPGGGPTAPEDGDGFGPPASFGSLRTLTDVGNADRLLARHGDDLRHVRAQDAWYVWDGERWKVDDLGLTDELAKDTARQMWAEMDAAVEAAEASDGEDEGDSGTSASRVRSSWRSHVRRSLSASGLSAMVNVARTDPRVRTRLDAFDADPWLLGVRGGVLDLREAQLLPPDRDLMVSRQVPVAYDEQATCPRWRRFILEIMGGDAEMAAYLQRCVGYSLTADVSGQALFFLHGFGANGKSTFLGTLRALLGDYGGVSSFSTFLKQDGSGRVRNDLARLSGLRFVVAKEPEEGGTLDAATVKDLTSAEAITARFLFKEEFEFIPTHKLWLAANDKPGIRDSSDGIWRRLKLIPFERQFAPDKREAGLEETLLSELPGILAWAVEGCMEWQKRGGGSAGLDDPKAVTDATAAYRKEQDIIGAFVLDRIRVVATAETAGKKVYGAYRTWAQDNGHGVKSNRTFTIELKKALHKHPEVSHGRNKHGAVWNGVGLQLEDF